MQVGEIEFRLPGPLLIKNMMMKLRTKSSAIFVKPEPMPSFAIG
jgi:hypothetical protein